MLDGREFFFLELNGRIQVEHPVTEAVTGVDLVQWQLRIARGRAARPHRRAARGHAVEVRLYAEDPRTFLPQAGRIERLRLPASIRVDAGVAEGDEVGTAYDPMIAKLIAHGATRDEALDRLAAALAETEVGGVTTNLPFLRWLVAHPASAPATRRPRSSIEHPPLSAAAGRACRTAAWRGAFRLNLPAPPPAPPPDVDAAAHAHGAGGGVEHARRADARHGAQGARRPGDAVEARQPLVVLEAMKMETPLVSPYDATVRAVHVAEGDRVAGGADARRARRLAL